MGEEELDREGFYTFNAKPLGAGRTESSVPGLSWKGGRVREAYTRRQNGPRGGGKAPGVLGTRRRSNVRGPREWVDTTQKREEAREAPGASQIGERWTG